MLTQNKTKQPKMSQRDPKGDLNWAKTTQNDNEAYTDWRQMKMNQNNHSQNYPKKGLKLNQIESKRPKIRPKLTKKALEGDLSWRKTTLNESKRCKSRL